MNDRKVTKHEQLEIDYAHNERIMRQLKWLLQDHLVSRKRLLEDHNEPGLKEEDRRYIDLKRTLESQIILHDGDLS